MIQTCGYTVGCQHTGYDWLPSWTSLDPIVHAGYHFSQLHCQSVIDWTSLTQKGIVCTPYYVDFCCIVSSCSYSEMIFYSASVNFCYIICVDYLTAKIPSVLWHCSLGDRKGIQPVKYWVLVNLVCWWCWFDWSFAQLIAPVVTTTSIIVCFNKHQLTQVCLENSR